MKKILLIHGIFMRPLVMRSLAKRLQKEGYEVEFFSYPLYPNKKHLIDNFLKKVSEYKPEVIVAHSFGGNITAHQLSDIREHVKSVVCLGSPLAGSAIAKKISNGWLSFIIPKFASEMLIRPIMIPTISPALAVIAGTKNTVGFRHLFPVLSGSNDGTVATIETNVPNLMHRIEMHVGHTAMLWSPLVAKEIIYFIENGNLSVTQVGE
jgi:pimeloyl-ACP methyl ester carboxylesterase